MAKIIGVTVGTTNPRPDWNQKNEKRADFIKNKPETIDRAEFEEAVGALSRGYGGTPIPYDEADDGAKLYGVDFTAGRLKFVDDTTKNFNEGGTTYLADGSVSNPPLTQWRKSLDWRLDGVIGRELRITSDDITAADHRVIGYFPEYNLENKTYTYEFEYFRNFAKRHKFYFANGNFVNTQGGVVNASSGFDPTQPCLALELNEADGRVDYKLYRQSAGFVNNTIFNRKTIPFEMITENEGTTEEYKHRLTLTVYDDNGEGPTEISVDFCNSDPMDLSSYWDLYLPTGYTIVSYGPGYEYVGKVSLCDSLNNFIYTEGKIYWEGDDDRIGESRNMLYEVRAVRDTVTPPITPDSVCVFKANMKVVLSGGAKLSNVTLYERHGLVTDGTIPNENYWVGDVIPIDYAIYHTHNGKDIKVAAGHIYQPANIGLVFGIGEYDSLAKGDWYGVRNLAIYKGDRIKTTGGGVPLHFNYALTLSNVEYNQLLADPAKPYRNSLKTTLFSRTPKVDDTFSLLFTDKKKNKVYAFARITEPTNDAGYAPFVIEQAMLLHDAVEISKLNEAVKGLKPETWTFTLEDGSVVTKEVYLK